MATPTMAVQVKNFNIYVNSPNKNYWDVRDFDGGTPDITAGYVATFYYADVLPNWSGSQTMAGTFTYNAAGQLIWENTQAQSILKARGTLPYDLYISNDGNATKSRIARGFLSFIDAVNY